MRIKSQLAILNWALLFLLSCCRDVPEEALFTVPANFPAPVYALNKNLFSKARIGLGRTLFYDGKLSRDGTIACGDCHSQPYAFTHHGHALSHGIDNRVGTRNSIPLQNLAWSPDFFWDGGVFDLDMAPIAPIQNHVEMDETLANVLEKLRKDKTYPALFKAAYGTEEITTARFLQSLSQFMLTMVSANSRYDRYMRKEGETLTADELAGLKLFQEKGCANCHSGVLFTDGKFRNNGLSLAFGNDLGRAHVTEKTEDRYTFKVPSLRNVEKTFPYMHDGRFLTLEAVLQHYASGVEKTPNIDPKLEQNGRLGIALSNQQQGQIVAFLKTLTDNQFLKNPNFAPQ